MNFRKIAVNKPNNANNVCSPEFFQQCITEAVGESAIRKNHAAGVQPEVTGKTFYLRIPQIGADFLREGRR